MVERIIIDVVLFLAGLIWGVGLGIELTKWAIKNRTRRVKANAIGRGIVAHE